MKSWKFPTSPRKFSAWIGRTLLATLILLAVPVSYGNTEYYRHSFFDNSLTNDSYFYSSGNASGPSLLELKNGKLPIENNVFLTPPNALRLEWQSQPGGSWEAEVHINNFRNRLPELSGSNLYLWCYAPRAISAADLPQVVLSNTREGLQVAEFPGSFTEPVSLGKFTGDLLAGRWVQVRIPLSEFRTASIYSFHPPQLQNIIFLQGRADGVRRTLVVDEIRIDDDPTDATKQPASSQLQAPGNVRAIGYDRHVEVRWDAVEHPGLSRYVIYRSVDDKQFVPIGIQLPGTNRYSDFLGKSGITAQYKVAASDQGYRQSPLSGAASAATRELNDDELLTMLQEACFRYYWEGADPASSMTRENIPGDDRIVATGASGFGIMALMVGVDRGFISREQGVERMNKIVRFLARAQRYHGVWSHYMNGGTGQTMPVFGMFDNGGDLVETSFLMQGLLAARQYFHGANEAEQSLYRQISQLWETVEWDWYRANPIQLTAVGTAGTPRWSPDGKTVAFDVGLGKEWQQPRAIFLVNADGATTRPLVQDTFNNPAPSWSRDRAWIYFPSDRSGSWQVWKVPATGGTPVQVTKQGGFAAWEAPDHYVYYAKHRDANPELWRVQRTPFWLGASADGASVVFDQPENQESHIMLLENFR